MSGGSFSRFGTESKGISGGEWLRECGWTEQDEQADKPSLHGILLGTDGVCEGIFVDCGESI